MFSPRYLRLKKDEPLPPDLAFRLLDLLFGLRGGKPQEGWHRPAGVIQSRELGGIGYDPIIKGFVKIGQPQSMGYLGRHRSVLSSLINYSQIDKSILISA